MLGNCGGGQPPSLPPLVTGLFEEDLDDPAAFRQGGAADRSRPQMVRTLGEDARTPVSVRRIEHLGGRRCAYNEP